MPIEKQFGKFPSPGTPLEHYPDLKELVRKLEDHSRDYSLFVKRAPKKIRGLVANLLLTQSVLGKSLKYNFYPYNHYPLIYHVAKKFMEELEKYSKDRNKNQTARILALYEVFRNKLESNQITIEGVETEMEELITSVCKIE